MIYVLVLNDMRSSQIQEIQPVAWATSQESLEELLKRERVEPYFDANENQVPPDTHVGSSPFGSVHGSNKVWGKKFRKGGPLEWFNDTTTVGGIVNINAAVIDGVPMIRIRELDGIQRVG